MLAELRAHYPEHQHTKKRKRTEKTNNETTHTITPHTTALPPNTNHHRYSTMTHPCHKDTALNQHAVTANTVKGMRKNRTRHNSTHHTHHTHHTPHHTPPFITHTTLPHLTTHHATTHKTEKKRGRYEGSRTTRRCQTQSEHGAPQHTPPPPFNRTTTQTKRGTPATDGRDGITAPALHSPCHPTTTMPPHHPQCPHPPPMPGGADKGTPPHKGVRTDTHPHTPHTRQRDSTRHDSSTSEYRTGTSGARAAPLDQGGLAAARTTAIQWSTRGGRTPPTHPLTLFTFTMINEQQ